MTVTGDEMAGVVDLFGALQRTELSQALAELAYRQGEAYDPEQYEDGIKEARRSYHLVAVDLDSEQSVSSDERNESLGETDEPLLLAGPLAFPEVPPDGADLPHILDIDVREVDTEDARTRAVDRFRREARDAIERGEETQIETMLDASYEFETWGDTDLSALREELVTATPTS